MNSSSSRRGLPALAIVAVLWVLVGLAIWQRMAIFDWWRLRGYEPSTQVAALADATTMNDATRQLFYVYHPSIEDKSSFNSHCRDGEYTIVLGCYVSDRGIYLFKIDDPRLQGVEEVTAAHETLHAAYDRLSAGEKKQVDAWTSRAFASLSNERIKTNIAQYREKDPKSVPSELHSILGTEVRDLPEPLENYYKKYFMDRAKIVGYSDKYEAAFSARQAQAEAYETQLKQLKAQIDATTASLQVESDELRQEYGQLNASRNNQDPTSFNVAAQSYNSRVASYNQKVRSVQNMIDRYNGIYDKYKEVVLEQQTLYKAIDSRPSTIPSQ